MLYDFSKILLRTSSSLLTNILKAWKDLVALCLFLSLTKTDLLIIFTSSRVLLIGLNALCLIMFLAILFENFSCPYTLKMRSISFSGNSFIYSEAIVNVEDLRRDGEKGFFANISGSLSFTRGNRSRDSFSIQSSLDYNIEDLETFFVVKRSQKQINKNILNKIKILWFYIYFQFFSLFYNFWICILSCV